MSVILLPDKWRRQPSGPAVLAPEWAKGARFVVSAGSGRVNLANGLPSIPGSRGISPSIGGLGLDYSSTADTPTNTGIDSFESSVNVTIFSCFIVRTAVAWSACIYDRNGWNGGTFGDDGLSYRYVWDGSEWSYSTGLTFGTNRVVAAAHSISANSAICAVDGRTDTRSVSNSARGFQNFANWFGSDPNGGRNLNGVILLAGICVGESWCGPRLQEWTKNPWQIFRKQPRILYFTAPSVGGATIAGDSLTHAHSLSSPSLTQSNVLAVQGVAQSHSLGAPALTQHNVLAVNAIAQAHALGNVTLTQAHILTVQGIGQAHSLGAPSLTQHNALTPAPLTQAQTLGNITLTIAGSIAAADIAQGHSIGTPALTQHNILAVAALMQAQSLGQPALAQAGTLAVDGMTHAQVLDAVTLVQHHALAVQALLQGHALGNVTLTASDALAIDGLTHAQILGAPSLTQHNVLAVQSMTHAQILQAVTLGGLVIGSLRGTLVAYSLLDGEVVCRALLSGSLETVH